MKFWSKRRAPKPSPFRVPDVPDLSNPAPRDRFAAFAQTLGPSASVLEIGTKRSAEERSTHNHWKFPGVPRERYLMCDIGAGIDVDVVADLHALPADWAGRFDAVVATAVFEHLERPWIAAREVARVLVPGGASFIATHQTYPLHGFPKDFFRFSREALTLIFEDAGLRVVEAGYLSRCTIHPPPDIIPESAQDAWNRAFASYISIHLMAVKD